MCHRVGLYPTILVADTCTSAPCSRSSVTIAACPAQGTWFGVWSLMFGVGEVGLRLLGLKNLKCYD